MDALTPDEEAYLDATATDPERRALMRVQLSVGIGLKRGSLTQEQALERLLAAGMTAVEARLALADLTGGLRE